MYGVNRFSVLKPCHIHTVTNADNSLSMVQSCPCIGAALSVRRAAVQHWHWDVSDRHCWWLVCINDVNCRPTVQSCRSWHTGRQRNCLLGRAMSCICICPLTMFADAVMRRVTDVTYSRLEVHSCTSVMAVCNCVSYSSRGAKT